MKGEGGCWLGMGEEGVEVGLCLWNCRCESMFLFVVVIGGIIYELVCRVSSDDIMLDDDGDGWLCFCDGSWMGWDDYLLGVLKVRDLGWMCR